MTRFHKILVGFVLLLMNNSSLKAQNLKNIQLDSLTIVAVKGGFSVSDFIDLVKEDTSFYQAFKYLRYFPYQSKSNLIVYNKSNGEKASVARKATQHVKNQFRWLVVDEELVKGKLRNKKKEYNYYTAELFDYIFFPADTAVRLKSGEHKKGEDSKNKSNEDKLKILIFNPGSQIQGVPLIGERMAIFDPDMVKYYDYKISSVKYKDTVSCYVFTCSAKQDLGYFAKDKPVIKELISYFDKKTFNIVSRRYVLSYASALFDFNVKMDVKLTTVEGNLVPELVVYQGEWDIPFRAPEIVNFNIQFFNYKVD